MLQSWINVYDIQNASKLSKCLQSLQWVPCQVSRSLFFWKRLWIMTQCHICYLLTLTIMLIISHDTLFMSKHPQTSVDSSVEESALKTFVVFERGDSGDLTFNQFKKVKPWHVLVWWSGVLVMFHRFLPFWLFLPVSPVSNQIHLFIGPRYTWGPIYGSRVSVTDKQRLLKLYKL